VGFVLMSVAIWSLLFVFAFVSLFCLLLSQFHLGLFSFIFMFQCCCCFLCFLMFVMVFFMFCFSWAQPYWKFSEAWPIPSHYQLFFSVSLGPILLSRRCTPCQFSDTVGVGRVPFSDKVGVRIGVGIGVWARIFLRVLLINICICVLIACYSFSSYCSSYLLLSLLAICIKKYCNYLCLLC